MTIRVSRDGTKVKLELDSTVPNFKPQSFYFYWECGSEVFAGLLSDHLAKAVLAHDQAVREEFTDYILNTRGFLHGKKRHKNWLRHKLAAILKEFA